MRITKDTPGLIINLIPEEEETPIRGNVVASGDAELDRQLENDVIKEYENGNYWAWFCAHVKVVFNYNGKQYMGEDYLGCCSYKNEADFKTDGYYNDMVDTCIDQINFQLAKDEHLSECKHCQAVACSGPDNYPEPIK